jgi:flagellar hook assembly protein FlgD
LASPRPNPAFRSVRILYSVPVKSRIKIAVYDVAGRTVKLLVDEVKNPGRYELKWQGRDNRDRTLPPGLYFIRMEGKNFAKTRKLILM